MFCNLCGHRNERDANFCSACGNSIEREVDDEATGVLAVADVDDFGDIPISTHDGPRTTSLLVVTRGPNAGERFALEADVTRAGRHPDSQVFLDDVTVSRRHVDVVRNENGYLARDAGSLNGTYLNRVRIDEAVLSDGDELQIGKFRLVFVAGEGRDT